MAKRPQFTIPGTKFEKPEKSGWIAPLCFFAFIVVVICASIYLFHTAKPMHDLDCDTNSGMGGLTNWGRCHDAQ